MNFYLDISAIGNEYQAYADTPTTWGVPQDGNGKAGPGASPAVAIATIDCATATCAGAGSILVMGQVVSSTLTGTGSSLATAIASAINGSGLAATATYSAALLPVNRLVFARVHPTINTTVQIMMRIAGVDWAAKPPTYAGTWSVNPTISGFTGGADGPFAYFWNAAGTVFGKTGGANVAPTYGLASAKSPAVTEPTLSDPIIVRSRRGGVDLSISHSSNASVTYPLAPVSGRTFVIDNGVTWAGDDGQFYISTVNTYSGGSSIMSVSGDVRFLARKYEGLRWRHKGTSAGSDSCLSFPNIGGTFLMHCENVYFEEDPDSSNLASSFNVPSQSFSPTVIFSSCHLFVKSGRMLFQGNGNGSATFYRYVRCVFEYLTAVSGIVFLNNLSASAIMGCEVYRCTFKDRNDIAKPVVTNPVTGTATSNLLRVIFDQCDGVAPFSSGLAATLSGRQRMIAWTGVGANKEFRFEEGLKITEWRAGASIPTLGHLLPSGIEWAIKCLIRDSGSVMDEIRPVRVSSLYRDTAAAKTVTLELLYPTAYPFKKGQMGLELIYTDSSDVQRVETTGLPLSEYLLGTDGNLSSSAASWSMNGSTGYSAAKLSLTTSYPIKQNTEVVGALVHIGRPPNNVDQTIIVAPQLAFS